jgi:RimJ/RimL family protein N-acetyltransferase
MRGDVDGAGGQPGDILTARLVLRPATVEVLRADLGGRAALARALDARVTDDWPPDLYDAGAIGWTIRALERDPAAADWFGYYFLRAAAPLVLIGVGGFKGPPDSDGAVEIGYSIVQSERRRGFATEAVRGFLARAFGDARVRRVAAETLPDLVASIGVLAKVGMTLVPRTAADASKEAGWPESNVIRYEIDRREYERALHRLPA